MQEPEGSKPKENEVKVTEVDSGDDSASEDATFYFESDHLALQGNGDYHKLLRTLARLEAQQMKAIDDLDQLIDVQSKALENPIAFVEKLQKGEDIGIPQRQTVANIPIIHWERYSSDLDPKSLGLHRHHTRKKRHLIDSFTTEPLEKLQCTEEGPSSSSAKVNVKPDNRSETYNKPWSVEEQQRLEEFLITFPPEEVEAKRWQKIAHALGDRTLAQVASRVQKYFIKLTKAGLPVPGRIPNTNSLMTKRSGHRHHRHHKYYYQPSTFMQKYAPPVYMSEDEEYDDAASYTGSSSTSIMGNDDDKISNVSDNEDISDELKSSKEYQELMELRQYKRIKMQESSGSMQHIGYKCDYCNCEPIVGVRFHCVDCSPNQAVDLCESCIDSDYETSIHNSSHSLEPIKEARAASFDTDYDYKTASQGYNYLDTNYMPAT